MDIDTNFVKRCNLCKEFLSLREFHEIGSSMCQSCESLIRDETIEKIIGENDDK